MRASTPKRDFKGRVYIPPTGSVSPKKLPVLSEEQKRKIDEAQKKAEQRASLSVKSKTQEELDQEEREQRIKKLVEARNNKKTLDRDNVNKVKQAFESRVLEQRPFVTSTKPEIFGKTPEYIPSPDIERLKRALTYKNKKDQTTNTNVVKTLKQPKAPVINRQSTPTKEVYEGNANAIDTSVFDNSSLNSSLNSSIVERDETPSNDRGNISSSSDSVKEKAISDEEAANKEAAKKAIADEEAAKKAIADEEAANKAREAEEAAKKARADKAAADKRKKYIESLLKTINATAKKNVTDEIIAEQLRLSTENEAVKKEAEEAVKKEAEEAVIKVIEKGQIEPDTQDNTNAKTVIESPNFETANSTVSLFSPFKETKSPPPEDNEQHICIYQTTFTINDNTENLTDENMKITKIKKEDIQAIIKEIQTSFNDTSSSRQHRSGDTTCQLIEFFTNGARRIEDDKIDTLQKDLGELFEFAKTIINKLIYSN